MDQLDQVLALKGRILDYLRVDRFRKVVWDVHKGLQEIRTSLQSNTDRSWILPGAGRDRQEAIADFVFTLEALEQYIADLQNRDIPYRSAGTGIGIKWLISIGDILSRAENLYYESRSPDKEQIALIRNDLKK